MAGENYRRVVPSFWTDPDVKRLGRVEYKLLALYFFTSPHGNMIGLYHCPLPYAARETGLPLETVMEAVAGPLAGFLTYDEETEEVFVHSGARHQIGDELKVSKEGKPDHRIAGVKGLLEGVHSATLKRAFLARYNAPYLLMLPLPDVPDPPSEALRSPSASPLEAPSRAPLKGGRLRPVTPSKPDTGTGTDAGTGAGTGAVGSADADGKPPPASEIFRAGPYIDDFRELRQGIPPNGQVAKYAKQVETEVGPEAARHRWRRFLVERPHAPVAYFAQEHGQYAGVVPGEIDWMDTHTRENLLNGGDP